MNCHKCGKPVEEGTEICENCGSNIQRKGIRENVISGTVGALIRRGSGRRMHHFVEPAGIYRVCLWLGSVSLYTERL